MTSPLPAFSCIVNLGSIMIFAYSNFLEIISHKADSTIILFFKYGPILQHQYETNLTVKGIFSTFFFGKFRFIIITTQKTYLQYKETK